jgi:hypothetical protein
MSISPLPPAAQEQARSIDTANSKLFVHVFKSGAFSAFADNHEVAAPISEGTIDAGSSRVKFAVDSRRMKVLDPNLDPDKRRRVQERMLGPEVLDASRFPQITFESSSVGHSEQGRFLVKGRLSLHGVTRLVSADVRGQNGRYMGKCTLKQRDFGIAPISIAGGTVKVKDELEIEFDIRAKTEAPAKE